MKLCTSAKAGLSVSRIMITQKAVGLYEFSKKIGIGKGKELV